MGDRKHIQKERNLKEEFRRADNLVEIDAQIKGETLLVLQKNIEEKRFRIINSRKEILISQLKYMDKSVICIQLIISMGLFLITNVINWNGVQAADAISFLMIISGVLAVVSTMGISRIFSCGIAEINESCYFNVRQIVGFLMLASGIMNLMFFTVEIIFAGHRWEIELVRVALYVLVPFVFTECVCLGVLLSERGRRKPYLLAVAGLLAICVYFVLASTTKLYRPAAAAVWGVSFIVGLLILGLQIKILFGGIKKGEIICMN